MVSADTSAAEGTRGYVSRLRSQQAADTRDRVVRAAAELFAERGYAGTTLPEIGRRAGVSTETVQNHGPKVELLRAAIAVVSFGAGPGAAVADTELGRRLTEASSAAEAARRSAEVLAAVNETVARGVDGLLRGFAQRRGADRGAPPADRGDRGADADRPRAVAIRWLAPRGPADRRAVAPRRSDRLGRAVGPPRPRRGSHPRGVPGADRGAAAGCADQVRGRADEFPVAERSH